MGVYEYQTLVPNLDTTSKYQFVYSNLDSDTRIVDPFPVGVDDDGDILYSGFHSFTSSKLGIVDNKLREVKYWYAHSHGKGIFIETSRTFFVLGIKYL